MPKGVYGKNFLREYVIFLGLNPLELIPIYEPETNVHQPREKKELFSKQLAKKQYFWAIPKVVKSFLIFIIILLCFFYLGFRLNKVISVPSLLIINPVDKFITQQLVIEVSGKTEAEVKVVINNEIILCDIYGNFTKSVNLKNGLNIITITASKKYGKSKTIIKEVLVK